MHRVFVYGTLKQGGCRHHFIAQEAFLGMATTEPIYRLYDLGDYPGLVHREHGSNVKGELYEVSDECLEQLDVVEGVAGGLYSRQPIELLAPWNESTVLTYIYEQSIDGCPEIEEWSVG